MYNIIALAGKAGSGKDTILQRVLAAAPDRFHEIVSCTTRPPREGEVEGKSYYFVPEERFGKFVSDREMLEYSCFNGWFYGTPTWALSSEKVNIGVFSPDGLRSLSRSPQVSLSIVHVVADDKIRLLRQLNREEFPDVKEIIRRFSADENDFKDFSKEFDYPRVILNEGAYALVRSVDIILGEANEAFGQK